MMLRIGLSLALTQRGAPQGGEEEPSGLAEVTEITCLGDEAGSLHGKGFTVYRQSGGVSVVLDASKYEITQIDCTGITGGNFVTEGPGKSFNIHELDDTVGTFWFNAGSESQPDTGAGYYTEIVVGPGDTDEDVANAIVIAAGANSWTRVGAVVTWVGESSTGTKGPRTDAGDNDSGVAITVLQQGAHANVEGGDLLVPYNEGDNAGAIAAAIASALDGQGWSAVADGDTVTLTDEETGARTDAVDGDPATGFTFTVTQQGA